MRDDGHAEDQQGGFILLLMVVMLVPLLLAVGAFSVAMSGRGNQLRIELDRERALLAAEAGVDDMVHTAQSIAISDGLTYTRTLAGGMSFKVTATHLLVDGNDNDGDSPPLADESPDEDVYQVIAVGQYRNTSRRIAAYLGRAPLITPGSALGLMNPSPSINLSGTPLISGINVKMNGTPAAGGDLEGLSIESPGTTATLLAELDPSEQAMVQGVSPSPSLGVMPVMSPPLSVMVEGLKNSASIVLTSNKYSGYNFGDGPAGIANITYREGDVEFRGGSQGAGILVITGDLTLKGNFTFWGIIIVLGDIVQSSAGTVDIFGSVIQGPAGSMVNINGNLEIHYSSEAVALANSAAPVYVAFNGWQELSQ